MPFYASDNLSWILWSPAKSGSLGFFNNLGWTPQLWDAL